MVGGSARSKVEELKASWESHAHHLTDEEVEELLHVADEQTAELERQLSMRLRQAKG